MNNDDKIWIITPLIFEAPMQENWTRERGKLDKEDFKIGRYFFLLLKNDTKNFSSSLFYVRKVTLASKHPSIPTEKERGNNNSNGKNFSWSLPNWCLFPPHRAFKKFYMASSKKEIPEQESVIDDRSEANWIFSFFFFPNKSEKTEKKHENRPTSFGKNYSVNWAIVCSPGH